VSRKAQLGGDGRAIILAEQGDVGPVHGGGEVRYKALQDGLLAGRPRGAVVYEVHIRRAPYKHISAIVMKVCQRV